MKLDFLKEIKISTFWTKVPVRGFFKSTLNLLNGSLSQMTKETKRYKTVLERDAKRKKGQCSHLT